ncbi:ATP-NAD kinase family protein [Pseudidiomarina mangrovi]|uniref:ATP-NAD kinase family protein n=1 Tax=Pseudidiomarina mangrovi TaxID=2487133 RepID=UPI000FCC231E|nr:ATP-NAD kinase family protein [Pseudidiomarina mangrovi]
MRAFRLGLIINPYAGLGGSVALKGSDGSDTAARAIALGAQPMAGIRVNQALQQLLPFREQVLLVTGAGELGESVARAAGFAVEVVYQAALQPSSAEDSRELARQLVAAQVDVLVFAGGDGTARDVAAVVPEQQLVLGIPAGVKIHSGVYAISPTAAGKVIAELISGRLTSVLRADVMDIDEQAFRAGTVRARRYGEMLVPAELRYVQAVKMGGKESDELVLADIAAEVIESMQADHLYVMGSGSTVAFIMAELGLPNTLLGVDVVLNGEVIASDVTAPQLLQLLQQRQLPAQLIVTVIGGQGHIFGRGNQQLSPAVIRTIGRDNIRIVASKNKLQQLQQRPLLVDTGDPALDDELTGVMRVTTGYRDEVLVRVGSD